MREDNIHELFFELIRVAIGNAVCLSHTPTAEEWPLLYAMAKKQSLVGVCFAGVQKLQKQRQAPNSWGNEQGEMLYLQWMGMAAKVQQRNEVVNKQCETLYNRFREAGFRACVLKGQGVAQLYGSLSALRQSGDIDIWVDGGVNKVCGWLKDQKVSTGDVDSVHVPAEFFKGTEVEVHFRPSYMYGCKAENLLMRFFVEKADAQFRNLNETLGFAYPTVAFNLVFSMVHINRHIYSEGIGLRQLMDYYMILSASNLSERKDAFELLEQLALGRFVAGVMFILQKCFGLDEELLLCKADEKEGKFLLKDIMLGGNFGHYDERNSQLPKSMRWLRGWWSVKRMLRYAAHYPCESLSMPFWKIRHYLWRKKKGYI